MVKTTGSCMCGKLRIEIDGKPLFQGQCYCHDCQKFTSSGHLSGAFFREKDIKIEGQYKTFSVKAESGNINSRHFCPQCSSLMMVTSSGRPGIIGVTIGCLDDQSWFTPQSAIFTRSKQPWDLINENIPHFEGPPPPRPGEKTEEK